jgi:mannonate dehydratase
MALTAQQRYNLPPQRLIGGDIAMSTRSSDTDMDRRDFARVALGTLGAAALAGKAAEAQLKTTPGIKLCVQSGANPSDEQLTFLKQLGAEYVSVGAPPELRNADGFSQIKKRYGDAGITVWNIGNTSVHNMPEVTLNLPGRDQKIEEYKQYLRNLGQAGIGYTTYAHMGNGIWTSGRTMVRGASAREFDQNSPEARGNWDGKVFAGPLSHGREFSKEEIWENYTHFIKQVAPVAEEAGVHIGIHPDDPPVPVLAGVPRCIFSNFDGYKRAMEIANSPNVGICLCCGTWLEGGKKLTGKDPEEMIRYFGARKIWKIHFRNVSAPLPHFVETFMDNGYYDMWKIMKALRDVSFNGIVILDHSPTMVGGNYTQTAYGFAYMKALLNRANAEGKG